MARFQNGYIKFHRKAIEGDLGQNVHLLALWVTLLSMAHWRPSFIIWKGVRRELPPGSVVFGITEIALKFGCSKNTVSKWLKYLHDSERVLLETCTRGSLVTILNWDVYQVSDEEVCAPTARQMNTKRTPSEHEVNVIEEVKKERTPFSLDTAGIQECVEEWGRTLKHFGADRDPKEDEVSIARLIQIYRSPARVRNALAGQRHEPKRTNFDPATGFNIERIKRPNIFATLETLGSQSQTFQKPDVNRVQIDMEMGSDAEL